MSEPTYSMPTQVSKPVHSIRLKDPVVEDLGVPSASVVSLNYPGELPEKGDRFRIDLGEAPFGEEAGRAIRALCQGRIGPKGILLVANHLPFDGRAIASFRNGLWPDFHAFRAYRVQNQHYVDRTSADGTEKLTKNMVATWSGSAVAAVPRDVALAPESIVRKFDKNAAGWSGDPSSPLYAHHRWMRRIVAELGAPKPGERVLDAGCGAGWVGIEAAKLGGAVSAFDPSPEMVKHALENAAKEGVALEAKQGFVEKPPFAEAFPLVLNSGVLSFAPDVDAYLTALDALVARGGRLVIGDLNPASRGMRRRRVEEPILPIRELNALTRDDVVSRLEKRGYRITARRFYQLTSPVPEWMHFSARRIGGFGCGWLLRRNARAAACDSNNAEGFDSWLVRAEKP